jgi:hypothetical protein
MIYLYIYLSVGLIVFGVIFSTSDMGKLTLGEILKYLNQDIRAHEVLFGFLLGIVGIPMMAVGMIVAWPWVLHNQYSAKRDEAARQKAKLLFLERENLIKRMSIVEVEVMERVDDPLGAVPDLPFGHLNSAWEVFKANAQVNDEIWTFMANWDRGWSNRECRGYALLRGNNVTHHFITGWKDIERQPSDIQPPSFISKKI